MFPTHGQIVEQKLRYETTYNYEKVLQKYPPIYAHGFDDRVAELRLPDGFMFNFMDFMHFHLWNPENVWRGIWIFRNF